MLPVAGLRFLRSGRFAWGPSLGIACGGVFGVLIAVVHRQEPAAAQLRWLVAAVVTYAAVAMLRSAQRESAAGAADDSAKTGGVP